MQLLSKKLRMVNYKAPVQPNAQGLLGGRAFSNTLWRKVLAASKACR
jgi:hypothetical protein